MALSLCILCVTMVKQKISAPVFSDVAQDWEQQRIQNAKKALQTIGNHHYCRRALCSHGLLKIFI